ncbi:alpha/beta hydrolase fold domain-containing protein [Hirsutella rhossiliensis]|uniref:Alpha/beta hydrolase fold domain-containing protein n=1 Tax=Hirsutella rhossiliensis TaxID=111463 RepID=A0A9P8MYX7_9HYPO|nr:alpha/beta hydrolase fold domain-containing protein [Hirsutella rhossiliensis]KAH0963850.1 alpha/beta hydrolase fold domain-containing protein [Hirsutella rhossiliensis]
MAPLWSSQPFKAVYTVFFLLKAPPHLALLFLQYLARPLRPLEEWDATTNLASAVLRMLFQYATATRSQRPMYTDPRKAKERLSRVEPAPDHLFTGILEGSEHEAIKPAPVDAIWFPSPAPRDAAELKKQKVVIHYPGGGYVLAFSHDFAGQTVADAMAAQMKATRTVWAQYRLSGTPETRFPAALQDAITFYHYVLSLGIDPGNIIVSGDSAGGNLVLALLRYLEDSPSSSLPLPGGAIIWSPWVHITAHAGRDYDNSRHSRSDLLIGPLLQWGAESFLPQGQVSKDTEAYTSPLHHPFKLSTPLFIHAGAAEAFHDDIKSFAEEMAQVNGHRVQFHATPLAPHNLLVTHKTFGMTEGLNVAMKEAYDFFERGK